MAGIDRWPGLFPDGGVVVSTQHIGDSQLGVRGRPIRAPSLELGPSGRARACDVARQQETLRLASAVSRPTKVLCPVAEIAGGKLIEPDTEAPKRDIDWK